MPRVPLFLLLLHCMVITDLAGLVLSVSVSNIKEARSEEGVKDTSVPPSSIQKASHRDRGDKALPTEPPQYMLDLYNKVADNKGHPRSPLPHGASLVRAVPIKEIDDGRFSFWFDDIPKDEDILEAEVHFYHHRLSRQDRQLLTPRNLFRLNLEVEESGLLGGVTLSQTVGAHFGGWRVFHMGEAVKEAKKNGAPRVTFVTLVTTLDGVLLPGRAAHRRHSSAATPLLVLFNRAANRTWSQAVVDARKAVLLSQQVEGVPLRRDRRSLGQTTTEVPPSNILGCELRSLVVSFENIGWSWVLHPAQYDAHHCVGVCPFPLGQELNPTNHATVVSILHASSGPTDPTTVRNPSCIPTSYDHLALLYYDEKETVILSHFEQMVATSCGCR